jgi:hypothetical protein
LASVAVARTHALVEQPISQRLGSHPRQARIVDEG